MKFELKNLGIPVLAGTLAFPAGIQAACNANITADAPDSRYTVSGDTVTDKYTGLMWKRCGEGWSGATCATGAALSVNWQDALKRVATVNGSATLGLGFTDWRLPNRNELATLVERLCVTPAINSTIFPGTLSQSYWTSSPYALNATLSR